jgi:hypothetical protein
VPLSGVKSTNIKRTGFKIIVGRVGIENNVPRISLKIGIAKKPLITIILF